MLCYVTCKIVFYSYFLPFQLLYAWVTRTHTDEVSPPSYCEAAKPPSYADCMDLEIGPPDYSQVCCLEQETQLFSMVSETQLCSLDQTSQLISFAQETRDKVQVRVHSYYISVM